MIPAQMNNAQFSLWIASTIQSYPDTVVKRAEELYQWLESKKETPGPIKYYDSKGQEVKDQKVKDMGMVESPEAKDPAMIEKLKELGLDKWIDNTEDPELDPYMKGFMDGYDEGLYDRDNK